MRAVEAPAEAAETGARTTTRPKIANSVTELIGDTPMVCLVGPSAGHLASFPVVFIVPEHAPQQASLSGKCAASDVSAQHSPAEK